MGCCDDPSDVVLDDPGDAVSSHADTIRRHLHPGYISSPSGWKEAHDALDALLAENQRLRDLGLILRNRNDQLVALAHKLRAKETALLSVCDAVTLAEAKRIAREALAGDADG